jgi:hypothetical protein
MEIIKPKIEDYSGRHIKIEIDKQNLDFAEAKDLAKRKAKETCAGPVLLSRY